MAPLTCLSSNYNSWVLVVVLLVAVVAPPAARSDLASDREECANQLVGLATSLQYVEGKAASPTPDCCSGMKQVAAKSIKCLCMLIRDRNDPQLGVTINVSLALGLPSRCSVPSNVSDCPRLLNLAPNSTDAQIFEQYGKDHAAGSAASASDYGRNAEVLVSNSIKNPRRLYYGSTATTSSSRNNKRSSRSTMAMSLAFFVLLHVRVQVRRKEHACPD